MRYFIIGYKSSGKTTIGKKLAGLLQMDFIDLDEMIEKRTGRTVPDIYSRDGEDEFRKMEWKALNEVVKSDGIVVSTGGGAPCHCDNMAIMEKHGEIIYIKLDDDLLVSRLVKATTDRPIVRNKSREELQHYVKDLRNRCEHYYLQAKYVLDGKNPDIKKFAEYLRQKK